MEGYKFYQIVRNIHQGTNIKIESFRDNLSSQQRLKTLKAKTIKLNTAKQLITGLLSLNPNKFMLCLLLFVMSLALTISGPFIISFIMSRFLNPEDFSLTLLVLIIILYKVVNAVVSVIGNFLSSSLGFQYFAFLYSRILNQEHSDLGKAVNIVEYDCNLLTNIIYSSLTSFFYFLEIMVLFGLLLVYLAKSSPFSMFFLLISSYLVCQCLVSLAAFAVNRSYMHQKDKRLGVNISDANSQQLLHERNKELRANKRFLLMKAISKFISLAFPVLINAYIFVITDRSLIEDNQYTILVLVNLIRSPIAELMTAMNLNAQILNSCQRISQLLATRIPQSSLNSTLLETNTTILNRLGTIPQERGNISLRLIWNSLKERISNFYWLGLLLLYLWQIASKYYSNLVTKQIMDEQWSWLEFLGLFCQIVTPIFVYLILISCSQKISFSIFQKLKQQIDYQTLNRISGDIAAIDRSVTVNAFEIGFSFSVIVSSYLYSITSLEPLWLQALLLLFLCFCFWLAYTLNRFIMRSRRQVSRRQLQLKTSILKGLLKGHRLTTGSKIQRSWFRIFECKQMGLLIQNYFMLIISLFMLLLSLILILISTWAVQDTGTKSILLILCLNIDRDIIILFFAMVRLELSLVSFERVINALSF